MYENLKSDEREVRVQANTDYFDWISKNFGNIFAIIMFILMALYPLVRLNDKYPKYVTLYIIFVMFILLLFPISKKKLIDIATRRVRETDNTYRD